MKILAVNAGSSSLKFTLIELPEKKVLANGLFEKIGIPGSCYTIKYNGEKITKEANLGDHSVAVQILMDELINMGIISSLEEIDGVGHRMVHGGQEFTESVVLTEDVLERVSQYNELAPLHNPANIMGVRAFMKALPNTIQVGVFDTAFHTTMEPTEYIYPVPYEWYEKYGVRKYGFHGTSHRYINKTISEYLKRDDLKVISCHIGNGGSITAIDSGKVVDTSMGFTPLAGIMMGTRCGDIDASMLSYLAGKTGKTLEELTNDLNKKSGLLGVSEVSSDSRDVENAANDGDAKAILAQEMYARKIANYIAMYNNLLGGADVITLTAGVGENSKTMRKSILDKIASLGVKIDEERNDFRGEFRLISTDDSKIPVYVVPTDEELMIALDTVELKNKNK
ncbi:acetate kinase 1 [Clostridium sp. CAG:609]|nr:acetate kinase 1 [Clostridium sp. CAG:609]